MKCPLVSIMIPAYNNPDYTRKTLQSIVGQEYRPLEVVFSDDCSPTPLEPLVEEFRKFETDDFSIKFFRQGLNLQADNTVFAFDQCAGKYVVYMPHDDWWTDKRFLVEAVELMENNADCHLCVANSEVEKTNGQRMIKLPDDIDAKDQWCILEGNTYINLLGGDKIGHQAWSAIVFNLPVARSLGAFHYPFKLTRSQAEDLGVIAEEGFAFQFLLASIGSVALTEKVVSVRGRPETAFCISRAEDWGKVVGQALFVIYYNLYKADLTGKYATAVKKRAREATLHWPVEKINLKILRHYHYAPDAIWLMCRSYALHVTPRVTRWVRRRVLRYPRYYAALFWRLLQAVRNGEVSQLVDKHKARGVRGLLAIVFPFR